MQRYDYNTLEDGFQAFFDKFLQDRNVQRQDLSEKQMDHLLKMFSVEQKVLSLLGEQVTNGEVDSKMLKETLFAENPSSVFATKLLDLLNTLDS